MALHPFERRLSESLEALLIGRPRGLLLAVSGGHDSTAMLLGLAALRDSGLALELHAASIDHGLRPETAGEIAKVRALSAQNGIAFTVKKVELAGGLGGDSLEARARSLRYQALCELAGRLGLQNLLTAHNADDQAETVLWRLITGAPLLAFEGIPERRDLGAGLQALRPLLSQDRAAVLQYLRDRGVEASEDASNQDRRFTRNRLRHDLLPQMAEINPRVREALRDVGREISQLLQLSLAQCAELVTAAERDDGFDAQPLMDLSPLLRGFALRRLLRNCGVEPVRRAHIEQLERILAKADRAKGELRLPRSRIARVRGSRVRIEDSELPEA